MKKNKEMYKGTIEIIKRLEAQNIKYRYEHYPSTDNESEHDWLELNLRTENIASMLVEMFIEESGFVLIKSFRICKVNNDKRNVMLKLVNSLNRIYIDARFYVDDENNICAHKFCDLLSSDTYYGSRIIDILVDYIDDINEAYPQIMEENWSKTDEM